MTFNNRAVFDKLRELKNPNGDYQAIGEPFDYPVRVITITNSTDQTVYISTNGVDHHLRLSPGSHRVFDLTANRTRNEGFFLNVGDLLQARLLSSTATPAANTAVWVEAIVHKS